MGTCKQIKYINDLAQAALFLLPDGQCAIVSEVRAANAFDPNAQDIDNNWQKAILESDILYITNEVP